MNKDVIRAKWQKTLSDQVKRTLNPMPNIVINGTITCTPDERNAFVIAVAEHIRLTRTEPGNIEFDITQSAPGSCIFLVSERFADAAAFEIHTKRTRASHWWEQTKHMPRDFEISEG